MTGRVVLACSVLVLSGATGCASTTEQYCSTLQEEKQTLTELAEGADRPGADLFGDSIDVFEELRDKAPDDVVDEWNTLIIAWRGLDDALAEADVSAADFRAGTKPAGVSDAEAEAIQAAADELRSPPVIEAGDGIEQHALDVCKVDLGL